MGARRVLISGMLTAASLLQPGSSLLSEQPDATAPMLHAYTSLVEIPVLVLNGNRLRARPLSLADFRISIDSGPLFAPRHVRQEGFDPIRLVLLVDASAETRKSIAGLADALPDLAKSLTARDTVSIALLQGCSLVQTEAVPAVLPSLRQLATFVSKELHSATVSSEPSPAAPLTNTTTATCVAGSRLRDAALLAMEKFTTGGARRVLLVMTDGLPDRSSTSVQQLRLAAGAAGVTIFALRAQAEQAARNNIVVINRDAFAFARPRERDGSADALVALTEWSGGTTLETWGHPLAEALLRITRLLRERYIVDFVRPSKLQGGLHPVEVRLRDSHLLVTSAGVGLPLIDPRIASDPNTVPSDNSREPPVGKRRILPQ